MFEQTFRNIDDVLWKEANCSTELDYTEQTSWMLLNHARSPWIGW
jgi:type I restriction enzyme M protein